MPRIAYGRIAQETNTLSPVLSGVEDFRRTHFLEGADLLARTTSRWKFEAEGMARNAELSGFAQEAERRGATLVPLFSAWAIPGGPLTAEAMAYFEERLDRELRAAGPLDGVMLSMHGAMAAVGRVDPEADLQKVVHRAVPNAKFVVTHDLHGHLTAEKVANADAIVAYRTNPHRDHVRTGARAAEILMRTLAGEVRPTVAWRCLPLVLGGGLNIDFLAPMRGIYAFLTKLHRDPRVLTASIYQNHLWNEAPHAGWGVYVATNDDPALAEQLADEIAERCWAVRHEQPPAIPSPSEAVKEAREAVWARRAGVVCISDASDMVGAGAPGENTGLLAALVNEGQGLVSYAPVRDAEVVAALWETPLGERVTVRVGGKLATAIHTPIEVSGTLADRKVTAAFGRALLLDLGHVKLIVTEGAPLAMKPAFYTDWGLPMRKADIVVVKSLFPFRWYFLPYNRKTIYAGSRGTTDFDVWRHVSFDRPVFPKDPVKHWTDGVRPAR